MFHALFRRGGKKKERVGIVYRDMEFRRFIEARSGIEGFLEELGSVTTGSSPWVRDYKGCVISLSDEFPWHVGWDTHSIYIDEISCPAGVGNAAMQLIVFLADKYGVTLEALVQPVGDKRMSVSRLLRWYGHYGFSELGEEEYDGMMLPRILRSPRNR